MREETEENDRKLAKKALWEGNESERHIPDLMKVYVKNIRAQGSGSIGLPN